MRKLRCTTFQSKPTITSEIENIIKTLKPNNSYRYDKISTKLLKITANFTSSPLNYICIKVITEGVFPDRLKYSIIMPLYKKRNKRDVINCIMGCGNRESCRNLFKELNILPLMSQHIISLLLFVSNNREQYFTNSEIHNINTRHSSNLHLLRAHLNIYQKVKDNVGQTELVY